MHLLLFLLLVTQGKTALNNCTTCEFCNQNAEDTIISTTSLCKCDGNCVLYGDCCESSFELSNCEAENNVPSGLEYICRSIYPNSNIVPNDREAFWMVSSCTSNWSPDEASQACMSDNCASLNSSLPPITDLDTGMVYTNEYYAICNRVQRLLVWQPNLACTSYVYQQIAAIGVQALFAMDPTIFQTQCQTCSYQMPTLTSVSSPRPCTVSISTCLDLTHLRNQTLEEISDEMYNRMVEDCENGPYDIVESDYGVRYRNSDCAVCNGEGEEVYDCFNSIIISLGIPAECAPPNLVEAPTEAPITEVLFTEAPTTEALTTEASITESSGTEPTTEPSPTEAVQTDEPRTFIRVLSGSGKPITPLTDIGSGSGSSGSGSGSDYSGSGSGSGELTTPIEIVIDIPPPVYVEPVYVEIVYVTAPIVGIELRPQGIPFTIALSNLGGGQVQVSVQSEVITVMVDCPDGQAALGLECRSTICPEGYVENGGRCAFIVNRRNTTNLTTRCLDGLRVLNISNYVPIDNDTVLYNDQVLSIVDKDLNGRPIVCLNSSFGEFFDCPTGLIQLNTSEFADLGNDTILYEDEVFIVVEYDDSGRPLICPPNTTTIVVNTTIYSYPEGYFILTYIGCSLSVIGSALVLLTYGLFKSLRTLPSLILMNLSAAILANNLLIIIGGPVSQTFPSVELCTTVAICLHFFFLSQFSWMTIMSFQMARTFYRASKMKIDSSRKLFLFYFVIGWSVPIAITAISIVVDFTTEDLVQYGVLEDGRQGSCWINHFESAVVLFTVPLVVSFLINMILFFIVTTYLCLAARSSSKMDKGQNAQYFRVNVATFSVTGLTWVFGFIALLAGTNWAWYPFIILNSTQGFVIFIAFVVTKGVLHLYWNLLTCRKSFYTSSSGTQKRTLSQLSFKTPKSNSLKICDVN